MQRLTLSRVMNANSYCNCAAILILRGGLLVCLFVFNATGAKLNEANKQAWLIWLCGLKQLFGLLHFSFFLLLSLNSKPSALALLPNFLPLGVLETENDGNVLHNFNFFQGRFIHCWTFVAIVRGMWPFPQVVHPGALWNVFREAAHSRQSQTPVRCFNQRCGVILRTFKRAEEPSATSVRSQWCRFSRSERRPALLPSVSIHPSLCNRRLIHALARSLFSRLHVPAAAAAGTPTQWTRSRPTTSTPPPPPPPQRKFKTSLVSHSFYLLICIVSFFFFFFKYTCDCFETGTKR